MRGEPNDMMVDEIVRKKNGALKNPNHNVSEQMI